MEADRPMKIDYRETTEDLKTRIDIHSRYGSLDIDAWMLDLLAPKRGSTILDVGCGAGKQCLAFFRYLAGEADITGGALSTSPHAVSPSTMPRIFLSRLPRCIGYFGPAVASSRPGPCPRTSSSSMT